jgi:hypothetical protein
MLDEIDENDRAILKASFDDLVQNNPKSEVAALKIKKVAKKVKHGAQEALYRFAVDVASETAKKMFTGGTE